MESSHKQFIGWVPCISGALLFDYATAGHPSARNVIAINHVEPSTDGLLRSIAITSTQDLRDDISRRYNGNFRFIAIAKAVDSGPLEGSIYVIPAAIEERSILERPLCILKEIQRKSHEGVGLAADFESLKEVCSSIEDPEVYEVRFSLDPTGLVLLEHDQTRDSPAYAEDRDSFEQLIVRQSFYYLKYALHRHHHHDQANDSLTTVHPFSADNLANAGTALLADLKRALVELKRNSTTSRCSELYQAEGICAYAKSLLNSCLKQGYIDQKNFDLEGGYLENFSRSLSVTAAQREKELQRKNEAATYARALILAAFAIVGPFMIVFRDRIAKVSGEFTESQPDLMISILATIFSSDQNLLYAGLVLVALYFVICRSWLSSRELSVRVQYATKFLQHIEQDAWKRRVLVVLYLLVTAGLLYAIWYGLSHHIWSAFEIAQRKP